MVLLLLCLLGGEVQGPRIDDFGAYQRVVFFQTREGFLMTARSEHVVALSDARGRIVHRYDRQGQGPEDLNLPVFLGEVDGGYLIVTHHDRLLRLDAALQPHPVGQLQGFGDTDFAFGLTRDGERYWVRRGLSLGAHLVVQAEAVGHGFVARAEFFPQPASGDAANPVLGHDNLFVHHGVAYLAAMGVAEDAYHVAVYRTWPQNAAPDLMLTADLDGFRPVLPSQPFVCFIEAVLGFSDGYLVAWKGKARATDRMVTAYVDVFRPDGGFVRRVVGVEAPSPCINGPWAFAYADKDSQWQAYTTVASWLSDHAQ